MDIRARYLLLEDEHETWRRFHRAPTLRRTVLRHLGVGLHDQALVLLSPAEPYFADVRDAAAVVRRAVHDFGAGPPTVHSLWLYSPVITGDAAEDWLDEVVEEHRWWWPNDVSWVSATSAQVLYRSDSYGGTLTLFVWGEAAELLLHRLAVELRSLPKVAK